MKILFFIVYALCSLLSTLIQYLKHMLQKKYMNTLHHQYHVIQLKKTKFMKFPVNLKMIVVPSTLNHQIKL